MKVTLDLTKEELEKLKNAVSFYDDEGPYGQGWQSDLLSNLSAKIQSL